MLKMMTILHKSGILKFMQPEEQHGDIKPDQNDGDNLEMYTPEASSEDVVDGSDNPIEGAVADVGTAPIHWVASEYVHEDRNGLWYVLFAIVVVALIAIAWFLQAWTFVVLIIVMAVALIVYINRPPRDVDYTLSVDQGLYIGEKLYHFSDFKSFGLIRDYNQHSIMLIPIKRFQPGVSVYFPDEVGESIVDILGSRLPMQDLKLDAIDVIVRKLRL
jgi:hypothetical protein